MTTAGATSPTFSVWCAIPAFQNARTVRDVAACARGQLDRVVVVDDGSTDAPVAELLTGLDVTVLTHGRNLGKGAALLTALRHAAAHGATHLIALDADGQHLPDDIPLFLPRLDSGAILIGRRAEVLGAMPSASRFGRAFSDFWVRVETGVAVCDTQSGFRAYPIAPVLKLAARARRYDFEVELVTRALWAGLRVDHVPIRVWYPQAAARVSSFRPLKDNLRLSLLHSRLVARQLLPIPHRMVTTAQPLRAPGGGFTGWLGNHTTPLGLAGAAALGLLLAALPWPLPRLLLLLYLVIRLHLNKPAALAFHALGLLPWIGVACIALGRWVLTSGLGVPTGATGPAWLHLHWLIGSMAIGPALAALAAAAVYLLARRFFPGDDADHEHR